MAACYPASLTLTAFFAPSAWTRPPAPNGSRSHVLPTPSTRTSGRQSGAAFIIARGNWPLSRQTPGKCHFLPALITGLLQTPEYMRAAMDTPVEPAAGDTATAIALKLERQAVLYDKSKRFEFLLTESALRWQLCEPSVMAVQLDRLVSLSLLPNIRIGVLPLSTQIADGPYHAFVIYDDHIVTIELSGAKDSAARLPGSLHRLLVRPALLPKRLRRVAREHVVGAAERGPGAAVGAEAVVADLAHPGPRTWRKDRQWREWYS